MSKSTVTTLEDKTPAANAPEAVQPEALKARHDSQLSGERMILTIHNGNEDGGKAAVFLGLNGIGYQIPRGKPWNVPAELVSLLNDAKETHYERDEAGAMVVSEVPRLAFTALSAPALA